MSEEEYYLNAAMKPCSDYDGLDWLIAFVWPLLFIVVFAVSDSYLLHWFMIPVYFCGVLISPDAVHWLRGRMDTYDPKGLVGLFGCNFFVLSPILAAYYRAENYGNLHIEDLRPWLGGMAFLNLLGILLYLYFERKVSKRSFGFKKLWFENPGRSSIILPLVILATLSCHAYFTMKGGGISAYMTKRTYGEYGTLVGTAGLGPINVIGRALPIMLLITVSVWFRRSGRPVSLFLEFFVLAVFFIAQFLVAGLTGSRAAIIWPLFWATGIMHFFWRPFPVKVILISLIPLVFFAYIYGFYKEMGTRAFGILTGEVSIESLEYESKRTFAKVLVGDLGRSDVQAGVLSVVVDPQNDYDLRYGKTYLTSPVTQIPRKIWPSKPDDTGKVIATTEMFYGRGSYMSQYGATRLGVRSTHIVGLAGEAMLNFGVWGVLPAFAVWGCIVGWIRRRVLSYPAGDMRLLLAPYFILMCFFLLIQDLDNCIAVSVQLLLVPAIVVWLISLKPIYEGDIYAAEVYGQ